MFAEPAPTTQAPPSRVTTASALPYRSCMRTLALGFGAALLGASATALAASVSPEIPLDTPVTTSAFALLSPRPDEPFDLLATPLAAFGGDQFFAVWSDARAPRPRLYGARVQPDGTLLDPLGMALAETDARPLAIASDGKDFLVVLGSDTEAYVPLRGLRVSHEGQVLDPVPFPLTTSSTWDSHAAVTFDGTNYLVVWFREGAGASGAIYRARVSPGGQVLDPGGVRTSDAEDGAANAPAVASRGISSLVVWTNGLGIRGKRITPDGASVDAKALVLSPTSPFGEAQHLHDPAIVWTGAHYLLSWIDGFTDDGSHFTSASVFTSRIGVSGKPLDAEPSFLYEGSNYLKRGHGLSFDGTNSTLAWVAGDFESWHLGGARVDAEGVIASLPLEGVTAPNRVGMAAGGGETLVLVEEGTSPLPFPFPSPMPSPWRVTGLGLGAGGAALGAPFDVARSANPQSAPAVACGGGGCLAVWEDGRNAKDPAQGVDLYGARLDLTGKVLDTVAIPIATATGPQAWPEVVFDGKNFLVAFRNSEVTALNQVDIAFVRVSSAGAVLDPAPLPLSSSTPSEVLSPLASNGAGSVYIGHEDQTSPRVVRVSQDGVKSVLANIPETGLSPAITFGAGNYFATWVSTSAPAKIRGVRIGPNGALLDAAPIDVAQGSKDTLQPKVAFDGTNYFVAWKDGSVRVARVSTTGKALDPTGIILAQPSAGSEIDDPVIAFDGNRIVVTWRERDALTGSEALRGAAVGADGALVDTFDLSAGPDLGPGQSLASLGNGKSLALYARFRPEEPFAALRATARIIDSNVSGKGCSAASDCVTGFCVDGVCCDSACGGGEAGDCQACSVAAGALVDGTCAPLDARPCEDGLSCSEDGLCQAGVCAPGPAALCEPAGECFLAGICDPTAEACAGALVPNGTPCTGGGCNEGICVPFIPEEPFPEDPSGGFFPGGPFGNSSDGCDCRAGGEGSTFGGALAMAGLACLGLRGVRRRARAKR